jgi:hypothetical protein
MSLTLQRGKHPYVRDGRDIRLTAAGLDLSAVTVPDGDFGNYPLLFGKTEPDDSMFYDFSFPLGMYGNDVAGDCVEAEGAGSETLDSLEGDRTPVTFDDACVLGDYSKWFGYDPKAGTPGNNPTDQGSSIREYLRRHRKEGITDAAAEKRHIGLFGGSDLDLDSLWALVAALGKAKLGVLMSEPAMRQFNAKEPFSDKSRSDEGHCIGVYGRYKDLVVVRTWGTLALAEPAWLALMIDEAWGYFSTEQLHGGKTVSGLDREKALAVAEGLS